jgi:hypothetical protein
MKMNVLPGVPEINDLNNNYDDNYKNNISDNHMPTNMFKNNNKPISISDNITRTHDNIIPNYTMNPNNINNYASIGVNSKEFDREHQKQQYVQSNLSVGNSLEEEIINERIPAEALHTSNNAELSKFVPVYDKVYYDVSPI